MNTLPERPSLEHLRKQAKDLLALYRRQDASAFERLRRSLPSARREGDSALSARQLRLHDMLSCIAREYGFTSWAELKNHVEVQRVPTLALDSRRLHWLRLVYGGDLAGGGGRPRPAPAARRFAEDPELVGDDPYLACAVGDEAAIRRAIERDSGWVDRVGGPLNIPPLIAVAHSGLARLDPFRESLYRSLRRLLDAGADPNASFQNRWPPSSLEAPGEERLTAIYGAAGKVHDERMTEMLLAAGADPNDNESLYHSVEDPRPDLPCTRLLLQAGTRVAGTNALLRVLDFDNLEGLKMLLAHTEPGDPDLSRVLHWAIHRGRSAAHVRALLDAGADPRALRAEAKSDPRRAASFALPEVIRLLEEGGSGEPLSVEEKFVAACARADEVEARRLLGEKPGLFSSLSEGQQKQLPNLAMSGSAAAVRLMVELGWPIAVRGGDIDGSALNWAVFRGEPALAGFLLDHGASFREEHGYDSDVLGTLSWASLNEPHGEGDWPGCAAALLAHGLPRAEPVGDLDPSAAARELRIDGRTMTFAADAADVLLGKSV